MASVHSASRNAGAPRESAACRLAVEGRYDTVTGHPGLECGAEIEMDRVTMLVSSFDAFADCWPPFCHGLRRYWADCPYDVAFITNHREVGQPGARALRVGTDRGWSGNMLLALEQISTPYVLYTHEDFWISSKVETAAVEAYVSILEADRADYVRLYPCPAPDRIYSNDPRLGVLDVGAKYRAALQMALWRKSVLAGLIRAGETPWQFEALGTERSRTYGERFLSVRPFWNERGERYHHGVDYVCTAVNKGRWSRAARRYAEREGLSVDFTNRPLETWIDDLVHESRWVALGLFVARNPRAALRKALARAASPNGR